MRRFLPVATPRWSISLAAVLVALSALVGPLGQAQAADSAASSAPTPEQIAALQVESLDIETGRSVDGAVPLTGLDARQQLVVTAHLAGGQLRDFTNHVTYESAPAGVVQVDNTGRVTPMADGKAKVTARSPQGVTASIEVVVTRCGNEMPINFPNQVVPIFTKLSCNGGGCHGKASGQNGFKLVAVGL